MAGAEIGAFALLACRSFRFFYHLSFLQISTPPLVDFTLPKAH
jgi:hypothetical protein